MRVLVFYIEIMTRVSVNQLYSEIPFISDHHDSLQGIKCDTKTS